MKNQSLLGLLSAQKLIAARIRSISGEILNDIELALIGDENACEKLKKLASKEYQVLQTFLKISSLLIKVCPIEQAISTAQLTSQESQNQITDCLTEDEINIIKGYIIEHEQDKIH